MNQKRPQGVGRGSGILVSFAVHWQLFAQNVANLVCSVDLLILSYY